jgi:flagellar assembly protein FliH
MTPRIIKQGTARAATVQQFSFSSQCADAMPPMEQPSWVGFPLIEAAAPKQAPAAIEIPPPAEDPVRLEKEAYETGLRQGEKAGMEIAEHKMAASMRRYAEAICEVGGLRSSLYSQIEHEVVKLAIAVARKIVHREIQIDRDIVQSLVRVALSRVAEKSSVSIHLNPVDYGYLMERRAEMSQSEGRAISLISDNSIERGGCLIQTDCGAVDARLD